MNGTLLRALIALAIVFALSCRCVFLVRRSNVASSWLQLFGAMGFLAVVASHICEGLNLFPWMAWGRPSSAGHYFDLTSAVVGITLFCAGFLLSVISKKHT